MDMQKMQTKATTKINQYGRTITYTKEATDTSYTDSVTGAVVENPVLNYNGELVNPATMNTVTPSVAEVTISFKGLELESTMLFGDYTADANFLGALITEETISFMIPAGVVLDVGDSILVDGILKNITKIQPIRPGDITIYQVVQVKR